MYALPMAASVRLSPRYQLHHGWVCLLVLYKDSATQVQFGDNFLVMGREEEKLLTLSWLCHLPQEPVAKKAEAKISTLVLTILFFNSCEL